MALLGLMRLKLGGLVNMPAERAIKMIDYSKIKKDDEVQIANGDFMKFNHFTKSGGKAVLGERGKMICVPLALITDHRPAEPVVPKGEGCVDWGKDVWLICKGKVVNLTGENPCSWQNEIAQGNVSNNYEQLVQERDRRAIKQELMECDGAVYEPVVCKDDGYSHGVQLTGTVGVWRDCLGSLRFNICHFINGETAAAALEKVGAERIRKAWGLSDDR